MVKKEDAYVNKTHKMNQLVNCFEGFFKNVPTCDGMESMSPLELENESYRAVKDRFLLIYFEDKLFHQLLVVLFCQFQ